MSINKFGVTLRKALDRDDATCKNYVRQRALYRDGENFDARDRKIVRLAEAKDDTDAVNKVYLDKRMAHILKGTRNQLSNNCLKLNKETHETISNQMSEAIRQVEIHFENSIKEEIKQLQRICKGYFTDAKKECEARNSEMKKDITFKLQQYIDLRLKYG